MFAIRTTLSKILGPLFSYTSYGVEIIADFYFDLELVTVESEISAAFVVSPNRSIGDVMWTIPRALYLLMYHLLTDSLINSRENAIFFAATLLDHDTKMRFLQMFIKAYYIAESDYDPVFIYYKSLHAHSFFGNPAVSSSGSPESAVTVERKSP